MTSVHRHEKRDTILKSLSLSYYANPTSNVRYISWCLRFQFISASRDPKNSTLRLNGRIPNSHLNGRNSNFCLHGPISTFNWLFLQNPQILRTISSGHDVIHTPAPFPVRGLLCQRWLSYPLRVSVKLYPMTMHLNS